MKNPALLIGSFIAAALLLLVVGILWLSGGRLFQHKVEAVINFKDGVAGLTKGAQVTFRGVPVGEVAAIELELNPATGALSIPVHVLISENVVKLKTGGNRVSSLGDLRSAVRDGLRAKLVLQSVVTGQKAIDLDILRDAPPVQVSAGLPTEIPVQAASYAALQDQLADLPVAQIAQELLATLRSVRTTLAAANTALAAAGTALAGAGRTLAAVGSDARHTLAAADLALTSVQGKADLALVALTRLADHADQTVGAIRPELEQTLAATGNAAESARLAAAQLARLSAPEGPLGDDLRGAVSDLAVAARGLRDWSELLDDQPNALIFGRQPADREDPARPQAGRQQAGRAAP